MLRRDPNASAKILSLAIMCMCGCGEPSQPPIGDRTVLDYNNEVWVDQNAGNQAGEVPATVSVVGAEIPMTDIIPSIAPYPTHVFDELGDDGELNDDLDDEFEYNKRLNQMNAEELAQACQILQRSMDEINREFNVIDGICSMEAALVGAFAGNSSEACHESYAECNEVYARPIQCMEGAETLECSATIEEILECLTFDIEANYGVWVKYTGISCDNIHQEIDLDQILEDYGVIWSSNNERCGGIEHSCSVLLGGG